MLRLVAVGLAGLIVLACSPVPENAIVDGWSVGPSTNACVGPNSCTDALRAAIKQLAVRDPNHAAIIDSAMHAEGLYRYPTGALGQIFRGGGPMDVALFRLADGSVAAIGVASPLGSFMIAFDHGPEHG